MIIEERLEQILYKASNPERYMGNEWNQIQKEWLAERTKVLLAFPDVYEIGMSHLGLKILYHLLNREDDILCERTYTPWPDLEELLREEELPLFSLESKHQVRDFDIMGFTLQYEMSYTNILNMLDLAGLPLLSSQRDEQYPLIIAGGSTVYNPEPLAPFIDLFFIGEAEEGIVNLVRTFRSYKDQGLSRKEILIKMNQIPGVYVPSLYQVSYDEQGKIARLEPVQEGIKAKIDRQVVSNLDQAFYPTDFIVPYMDIVHNRAVLEISRGCTRGCRFCAAGISYRPVRERRKSTLIKLADKILESTGYDEISLTSLSTIDYTGVRDLIKTMSSRYEDKKVSISLSSLRVDRFSVKLAREVQRVRKSGLTFAPEAGTQRLRDVINKGVNEEDLYQAVEAAFTEGWSRIKLYFMLGLPTETEEDLAGIAEMAKKVLKIGNQIRQEKKNRMKPIEVSVSVSTFVPKPFTPFQWVSMESREEVKAKQAYLRKEIRGRGLKFSWNDPDLSMMEGVLSRGDRRLAAVLKTAWEKGSKFDGWDEYFDPEIWKQAFAANNLTMEEYLKERDFAEILPWSHINPGVSIKFLQNEYNKALQEGLTEDCRSGRCTGCDICFDLNTDLELVGADQDAD